MEDITSGKHRKRLRKDKSGNNRPRNSSQNVTSNVLSCLSTTEKSYEKQIPRKHLTQGRITTRPGLFHQGKCTSFVHRALCFSPTKKARMDEDLHRIIQLANGIPVEDSKYRDLSERPKNVNSNFRIPTNNRRTTGSMDVCEDLSVLSEDYHQQDSSYENPRNEKRVFRTSSKKLKNSTVPGHEKMETDVRKGRSSEKRRIGTHSSTSSSSNDSPSCPTVRRAPSLAEYEEFSAAAVEPLNSKKIMLFSGRDYCKEVRERIKTIVHQKQINMSNCCMNTTDAASQEDRLPSQKEDSLFNDIFQSRVSPIVTEAPGTGTQVPLTINQHANDDFSPYPCILSPKTTILNPIEYLRRVELASKQRERLLFDSGHESGQSHGSSLTNSQSKTNFYHDLPKSYDPSHYSLETNECCIPSQSVADSLLYQHSNRSFIDSPQAFKIRDGNFQLKHNMPSQRIPSELNTEHDIPGLQYLMEISEIGSSNLGNPCDLLDELDCDSVVDSNIVSAKVFRRPVATNKWGPPPSPPTPEHKFYRRKMF